MSNNTEITSQDDLLNFLGKERYEDFVKLYFNPETFIKSIPSRRIIPTEAKFKMLAKNPGYITGVSDLERTFLMDTINTENIISQTPEISQKRLSALLGDTKYQRTLRKVGLVIKDELLQNQDDILKTDFRRVRVPTKGSDVFVGTTNMDPKKVTDHDMNIKYIVKVWDKKDKTDAEKIALDNRYEQELKNNNYYRRIGLNQTERQMSSKTDSFNFLIMTYLNGTDALDVADSLEEKTITTIEKRSKKEAIMKKDNFRNDLCDHIAQIHAFSSGDYTDPNTEDYAERFDKNIIKTYSTFFTKNSNLLDKDSRESLQAQLTSIEKGIKAGSKYIIKSLQSLPNLIYTDRFLRNITVDENESITSIDFGSLKRLPVQFDLAFPFIQGNDIPQEVKDEQLRTYFDSYPQHVKEYNSMVEEKLENLESTILEEIRRPGLCRHGMNNKMHALGMVLEMNETLSDARIDNLDEKRKDISSVFIKYNTDKKVMEYVDDIFDFIRSLEPKDDFVPTYDKDMNIIPATFEQFKEGQTTAEAYRSLLVGSAYTHYMKEGADEENLDYLIRMINSGIRGWNSYTAESGDIPQEDISNYKDALKGWKDIALKLKKGLIERDGTKKNPHLVDFHVHTGATEDARRKDHIIENNAVNMINAAYKDGLTDLAITNHIFLDGVIGKTTTDPAYLKKLCTFIDNIKNESKIRLHKGIEVDYLGKDRENDVREQVERLKSLCNGFDYILGSVHRIDGEWFMPTKDFDKVWLSKNPVEHHRKYYQLMKDSVESGIFNYIAHPGVISKFIEVPFETYEDIAQDIVKSAVANDVGLEINTVGLLHPTKNIYPNKNFLSMYINESYKADKRPKLILSSDSHSPLALDKVAKENLLMKGYLHALDCGYDGRFMPTGRL